MRPAGEKGRRRGSSALEAAMLLPVMFVLLVGMVEIARVTYTYYMLQKMLYQLARYVGTQQGVNFCDESDPVLVAAKNYAVTGTEDGSNDPLLTNLSADMIQVRIERYSRDTGELGVCDCSVSGCDSASGGTAPDFIVVTIPDGYTVTLAIPPAIIEEIPLKPQIRVPFGGTS
jgi:hypothetical protein